MKKILGAAAALSLIGSAAFADITVSGRGYVETQVFNYTKEDGSNDGTTKLFDNWDTGDSDVFISGDIGGKAGAMLNIDFGSVANGVTTTTNVTTTSKINWEKVKWDEVLQGKLDSLKEASVTGTGTGTGNLSGSWIGDWNVWIKPLDFLTIKASNEANRVANRYNSIIDKTESKWGTLIVMDTNGFNYKDANDDDSFKGYQVNMDFGVVKVDLGFNKDIQSNGFAASSMFFGKDVKEIGAGARVVVPVEGLLNVDALFKMYMNDDVTNMTFGAIVDVVAIDNMGLAVGYIGRTNDGDLTSAVDVRFQYNMDKMGFALHNNATFGKVIGVDGFVNKTNLGFMYGLSDAATLFVEVQNYLANLDMGEGWLTDVVTVYPRFAFGIAEGVTLKTGLRADFGLTDDFDKLEIALPLSMEVIF